MTTFTYGRRIGKTGRPLGVLDIVAKLVETTFTAIKSGLGKPSARNIQRELDARTRAATAQAAAVRKLADRQRKMSPGFAADLYAAADRHEIENSR